MHPSPIESRSDREVEYKYEAREGEEEGSAQAKSTAHQFDHYSLTLTCFAPDGSPIQGTML
jgi:hypothetical protein